jgi:hypothetical protein
MNVRSFLVPERPPRAIRMMRGSMVLVLRHFEELKRILDPILDGLPEFRP